MTPTEDRDVSRILYRDDLVVLTPDVLSNESIGIVVFDLVVTIGDWYVSHAGFLYSVRFAACALADMPDKVLI